MSQGFEPLDPNEVISLNIKCDNGNLYSNGLFVLPANFRKTELENGIKNALIRFDPNYRNERIALLKDGLTCEALRFGSKGWQAGKIRVKIEIEFCSDEIEEMTEDVKSLSSQEVSLDDIRQMISE